jgi:hypothetical protein
LIEGFEVGIAGRVDFAAHMREQEAAPVGKVGDPRRKAIRVQRDPERVRGRRAKLGRDLAIQVEDTSVRGDHVPVTVDDYGWIGLVCGQEPVQCFPHGRHLALVERPLAEDGGKAGRQEQAVAVAQWDVEAVGEVKDHLAARLRPSRLDEAEMPRRDCRSQGELELAEVAPLPPLP